MKNTNIQVDCRFPGGNIVIDEIQNNLIRIHQDIRDTTLDWFYWYFRVSGAAGEKIQVEFTQSNVIGARGPAVSLDEGQSWRWLGMEKVERQSFTFDVPPNASEVRFSFGMPYLQTHFEEFINPYKQHPNLKLATLCNSRKQRQVELLYCGKLDGPAKYHVLLTARHHCCEMMASYTLEGIVEEILAENQTGAWLRENVAFLIVPFMDKDGVEDGDQGKCRNPHDHNRDYSGVSIYPEVATLREITPDWSSGNLDIALDLHCPWIKGFLNEFIYFVGRPNPDIWKETNHFGEILSANRSGPIPFYKENNLPFGFDWNTGSEPGRKSFADWAGEQSGIRLASTVEIPYANALGVEVNPESARAFGRDMAKAIFLFLGE